MIKPHTTLSEAVRAMASMNPHAHGTFSAIEWDDGFNAALSAAADLVEKAEGQEPVAHPDDLAVDRFAVAMKTKMAASRAKGRSGWDDESRCTMGTLARLLMEHVAKGDPVDIANFAMMLHQREGLKEAIRNLPTVDPVPQANAEQDAKPGNSSFDSNYIGRKLGIIARDMRSYTAQEMARELVRLAKVSDESEATKEAIRTASNAASEVKNG